MYGRDPVRAEQFGLERLVGHARHLAAHLHETRVVPGRPLLRHFLKNRRLLILAHHRIGEGYRRGESFGPDAEWLLDNFHIVSEALFEIRTDLPRGYYQLLPKVRGGPLDGLPRVYALALELVAHCDSCLDEAHVGAFVAAFQEITPLTIGELWAIPIMLRLVVVDNLRRLAVQILCARDDRREAKAWADRSLCGPHAPPPGRPDWSDSFLVQLMDWMHEQGAAVAHGVEWLERHLTGCALTADKVLRRERQRQAANQVSIGNCVTSLRLLSALDWPAFFERTSLVDAVLREDPVGVYDGQDFPTRDRYRQAVEKLSRGSSADEVEVARNGRGPGRPPLPQPPPPARGGGEGGTGEGRPKSCRILPHRRGPCGTGASGPLSAQAAGPALRFVLKHPRLIYFGGVAAVTFLVLAAARRLRRPVGGRRDCGPVPSWWCCWRLPPASDVAVSLVNYWVGGFLPPRILPKMLFKEGLPAECAAFVVMPTLLRVRPRAHGRPAGAFGGPLPL